MTTAAKKSGPEFTADDKAAMKERARELKASAKKADLLAALDEAIAKLDGLDRELADGLHALVTEHAPQLTPKTWYGMPAYANDDDKIVCFFQPASKFGARYATLGFDAAAKLDDGTMWPTAFALTSWTAANRTRVVELVTTAAG